MEDELLSGSEDFGGVGSFGGSSFGRGGLAADDSLEGSLEGV